MTKQITLANIVINIFFSFILFDIPVGRKTPPPVKIKADDNALVTCLPARCLQFFAESGFGPNNTFRTRVNVVPWGCVVVCLSRTQAGDLPKGMGFGGCVIAFTAGVTG